MVENSVTLAFNTEAYNLIEMVQFVSFLTYYALFQFKLVCKYFANFGKIFKIIN